VLGLLTQYTGPWCASPDSIAIGFPPGSCSKATCRLLLSCRPVFPFRPSSSWTAAMIHHMLVPPFLVLITPSQPGKVWFFRGVLLHSVVQHLAILAIYQNPQFNLADEPSISSTIKCLANRRKYSSLRFAGPGGIDVLDKCTTKYFIFYISILFLNVLWP